MRNSLSVKGFKIASVKLGMIWEFLEKNNFHYSITFYFKKFIRI